MFYKSMTKFHSLRIIHIVSGSMHALQLNVKKMKMTANKFIPNTHFSPGLGNCTKVN